MLASQTGSYGDTNTLNQLLYASSKGDLQSITDLIEQGVDVNDCNETGQTALLAASIANKTDACALLLGNGAKVYHSDIDGYTALHLTTDAELTNLLLRYINDDRKKEFTNARTKNNITPLHEAAFRGSIGKVFVLLSNHADVNSEDANKATPLHYAVAPPGDKDVSFAEALIKAGADVNKQNVFLQTPLAIACKQHAFMCNVITVLLKACAEPVTQSSDGNTALHVLFFGTEIFKSILSSEIVDELVNSNRKCLETANLYGELPFHCALSTRVNKSIALQLLKYDPGKSDSKDNLGRTMLHLACEIDFLRILDEYVESTTLVNATDCLGRSILHYGCMYSQDGDSVKHIFESRTFQICGLADCFGYTAYQYAKARPSEVSKEILKHFDDHVKRTRCDGCMSDNAVIRKYSEVFEHGPKKLSSLLTQMVVETESILPQRLRPIANAEDYVNQLWSACESPVKNSENFEKKKRKVETFMNELIALMIEYDERFAGNLRMRGSAYEGTIADDSGDFDYMLDIGSLSSICSARERECDPPGFVRVGLDNGIDPGIFKDFFDFDGLLRSEWVMSKFSLAVMYALHQPSLWRTCSFDFFPKLKVTWKHRPALSITCRMFHLNTFSIISIDFLPAIHCGDWWPPGFDCHGFLDQSSLKLGCQLIIKPPNVPYYQYTQFGNPHQYLKMSFSEVETNIFQRSNANIRQALVIAKLLLGREVEVPLSFIEPKTNASDFLPDVRAKIQTKNCLTSFLLKQSLLNELRERQFNSGNQENDSVLVWVQRIYARLHKSLKEGCLTSLFLSNLNYLHTFHPDYTLEIYRNLVPQIIYHSLLQEDIQLVIDRNLSWHRYMADFELSVHSRYKYLRKILQSPEERV